MTSHSFTSTVHSWPLPYLLFWSRSGGLCLIGTPSSWSRARTFYLVTFTSVFHLWLVPHKSSVTSFTELPSVVYLVKTHRFSLDLSTRPSFFISTRILFSEKPSRWLTLHRSIYVSLRCTRELRFWSSWTSYPLPPPRTPLPLDSRPLNTSGSSPTLVTPWFPFFSHPLRCPSFLFLLIPYHCWLNPLIWPPPYLTRSATVVNNLRKSYFYDCLRWFNLYPEHWGYVWFRSGRKLYPTENEVRVDPIRVIDTTTQLRSGGNPESVM